MATTEPPGVPPGPPPGLSRSSLRVALIAAAFVLLVFEVAVRLLSIWLPPPDGWRDRELARQVSRMSLIAQSGDTCLAFVGSSAVASSVLPEALGPALGRDDWYVAWASGATARLLEPWTVEIVDATLQPGVVVVGITSYELNDAFTGREDLVDSYLGSPGRRRLIGATTLGDRAQELLASSSALVRYRQYLRSPAEVVARLTGRLDRVAPAHGVGDAADREQAPTNVEVYVEQYQLGGRQREAIARLIDQLRSRNVGVVLLDLPVLESEWTALHEHGERDIEAYRALLEGLARAHGVPLLHYRGQFQDPALFVDPIHLNTAGAALFSERLGAELRQLVPSMSAAGCS